MWKLGPFIINYMHEYKFLSYNADFSKYPTITVLALGWYFWCRVLELNMIMEHTLLNILNAFSV